MEETFTCETAALRCKCEVQTIRDTIKNGELIAAKIGKSYVIRQSHLDNFIFNKQKLIVQAVKKIRNRASCYTDTQMTYDTLISKQKAGKELDDLIAQKTKNSRRNIMIS